MLYDGSGVEVDHLYHRMIDAGVLDHLHVALAVEEQGVILLAHKIALHAPLTLVDGLDLVAVDLLEREGDTLHLQLAVGSEIIEEIVEELVGSLGHREIGQQVVGSIGNCQRVGSDHCRIGGDSLLGVACPAAPAGCQQ